MRFFSPRHQRATFPCSKRNKEAIGTRSPTGVNPQKDRPSWKGSQRNGRGENGGVGSCVRQERERERELVLRESKALYIERTPEGKKRRERKRREERERTREKRKTGGGWNDA